MKFLTFLNPTHQKSHFSSHSTRRSLILNYGFLKQNHDCQFFQNVSKRCYFVGNPKVASIRPLGGFVDRLKNMFNQHRKTVPFTKRKHFLLLSKKFEARMSKISIMESKNLRIKSVKGDFLCASDPVSVRIREIGKNIIDSLEKELNKEQVLSSVDAGLKAMGNKAVSGGNRIKANEVVDDKGAPDYLGCLKGNTMCNLMAGKGKGIPSGKRIGRGHSCPTFMLNKGQLSDDSEGLNWELVVVRNPKVQIAFCLRGGKIVVFTGILNQCKSDAEIAVIIAHEVGHAVARHHVESYTTDIWFVIMLNVLHSLSVMHLAVLVPTFLLRQHFERRREFEADYIGMMLMASAGYDPKAAITFFAKRTEQESWIKRFQMSLIRSHPPSAKRAQMLERPEVLGEALLRFKESPAR